jgi:tyrosyl-tRNA synthetase
VDGAQLYGVTTPLLATADGKKMGKTESGAVWLNATSSARTTSGSFGGMPTMRT